MTSKKKSNDIDALLFVDTNILLDFYRIRKSDISLKYLEQLELSKQRLIIGSQVEMEYKKNRQKVILEALNQYSTPDWHRLTTPALVSGIQASKMIDKKRKEINTQQKKVNEKIQKILQNPGQNDPVYQTLPSICKTMSSFNLNREDDRRFDIREFAKKRFILGYPPRKKDDTSIGDAVNWEWIVQCAIDSGKNIAIITRDEDYGVINKDESYLNDWLLQEFKERVSQKRKILLTSKLSQGLKAISAAVSKEMEEAEEELIEEKQKESSDDSAIVPS